MVVLPMAMLVMKTWSGRLANGFANGPVWMIEVLRRRKRWRSSLSLPRPLQCPWRLLERGSGRGPHPLLPHAVKVRTTSFGNMIYVAMPFGHVTAQTLPGPIVRWTLHQHMDPTGEFEMPGRVNADFVTGMRSHMMGLHANATAPNLVAGDVGRVESMATSTAAPKGPTMLATRAPSM